MAAPDRTPDRSVEERLFAEGWTFDFYQAVRLLEIGKGAPSVGEQAEPAREAVRFRSEVSLAFPPSDVVRVDRPGPGEKTPVVTVSFLGLAGAHGPLPHAVTELILERLWQKDPALRDFLDLFNHRLVSLLYRAHRLLRPSLAHERPGEGACAAAAFAFLGLRGPGLRHRSPFPDRGLLAFAGLLARRPLSAAALERLLAGTFGVPAAVRQLVGRWLEIEPDQRTALGVRHHALGQGAALGSRVWDQQGKFEIRLGPLKLHQFLDFLPPGRGFRSLAPLTRFAVDAAHDFDVRLTLEAGQVPPCRLGWGPRLGWSAWLKTRPFEADDSQVVLRGKRESR